MTKINELTDLKAVAILLLFFVHSNLQIAYNLYSVALQEFMLSAFFFVSGYLTWISFRNRQYSIRAFTLHRIIQVYVPFVAIMLFYVLSEKIVVFPVEGFLTHASFLSLFAVFAENQYAMYQFWFVPDLLAFGFLYIALGKYLQRTIWRLGVISAIFLFDLASYIYGAPFRLEYNIGLYIFVFAFGYEVAANNLIEKIRNLRWTLIPLLAVSVASFYGLITYLASSDLSTVAGRASYFPAAWVESIAFSIPLILVVLVILCRFRERFPNSKIYAVSLAISGSSLFMYLLEGYISPVIGRIYFNAGWYVTDIVGAALLPSIAWRIIVVAAMAYVLMKAYNAFAKRFETAIMGLDKFKKK